MYKSLLIHYEHIENNILLNLFDERIKFALPNNKSLDLYITEVIIAKLKVKEFDVLYIKDSLSLNYLELFGLRVAYHVRLSAELNNKMIVILSDVNTHILNRLDPMAKILFTQNMFTISYKKESIEEFEKTFSPKEITSDGYKHFLNYVSIEPPKETSHDIANEWAMYRWAEFLNINDKEGKIENNKLKIASMLYFKYLLAKNPISKNSSISSCVYPVHAGNILFIDDDHDKGWSAILEGYFLENPKTNFDTFDYDFKKEKLSAYQLVNPIQTKIKSCKPDVIILDLRLTQDDKLDKKRKEINFSGIRIRQLIEEINPGIQVIMLTATSKSTTLEKLYEHGILGYIKKEHPSDTNVSTRENFVKLAELIDKGMEKKCLKEVWGIQENIIKLQVFEKDEFQEVKFEIGSIFEVLDSELENKYIYAMLAIFKAMELINNLFVEENFEKNGNTKHKYAFWKNSDKKIMTLDWDKLKNVPEEGYNLSTEIKIRNILYKLGMTDNTLNHRIKQIVCSRNYAIHPEDKKNCRNLTVKDVKSKEILEWFRMLQTILLKINKELTCKTQN